MFTKRMVVAVHLNGLVWPMMAPLLFTVCTFSSASSPSSMALRVIFSHVAELHDRLLNSGYDSGLCEVIVSMLQREPGDRPIPHMAVNVLTAIMKDMEGEED